MADNDKLRITWDDIRSAQVPPTRAQIQPSAGPLPAPSPKSVPRRTVLIGAILVAMALPVALVLITVVHGPSLPLDELRIASLTVYGGWMKKGAVSDDRNTWAGSAFVVEEYSSEGHRHLHVVTNAHCLGLERNKKYDDYVLLLQTQTGKRQQVERMAVAKENSDVALLDVQAGQLVQGKDYVIVPYCGHLRLQEGDPVIAVGNALGFLPGSQTRGTISAIREDDDGGGQTIQHDAAVNHGNSGGPLFLLKRSHAYWIGINTFVIRSDGAEGLNFAIPAYAVMESDYEWVDADPGGARRLSSH